MASAPKKPFSLRPWPHGDRKPKSLGEFIARVNSERGGFRTVTEESLRKEIEAQENGADETNGADEMDLDSDEEADSAVVKIEDIVEAKSEVMRNAEYVQSCLQGTVHQHYGCMLTLLKHCSPECHAGSRLCLAAPDQGDPKPG